MSIYNRIIELISRMNNKTYLDVLEESNINIRYCDHMTTPGTILMCEYGCTIYLANDLPHEFEKFVVLHELAHYQLDYILGTYSFNARCYASRSEFRCNLFACLYLLKDIDVKQINIPEYLILNGCPINIAWSFFEYYIIRNKTLSQF